jgi:signal transduction histidine kinase
VAWAVWGLTVALIVFWPFLVEATSPQESDLSFYVVASLSVMGYATVGALITSRQPGNRIGLILAWIALAAVVGLVGGAYAVLAFDASDPPLPFAGGAAWLGRTGFPLMFAPIPLIFLLFPTGKVPSPRWRWLLWTMLSALAINAMLYALTPGSVDSGFTELETLVTNPLGLPSAWKGAVENVTELAGLIAFAGSFLCVLSLVMRYRRAAGDERQQIRWLAYVAAVAAAIPLIGLAIAGIREVAGVEVSEDDFLGNAIFMGFFIVILIGVPAACAIAILRYRLYELDVIVKKTVVFGALALFISAVYLVAVFVVGSVVADQASSTVSFAAGAAAALAFQPLRMVARRLADRLVYGRRATPYEVLSEFSDRLADTYSTDDVLPRMASLLGTSTGATEARVWLLLGEVLSPVAAWPQDLPPVPSLPMLGHELSEMPGDVYPVRHQGEVLGAFTLAMPGSDPMNPAKARLVEDLAAQAGLVLRNVRLLEELRASRRRIVEAQDERAKKLERDIHDGAQQQLVALSVKLRLADSLVERDPDKLRELLAQLQVESNAALEDLRDLARGIYPPLLADQGLQAALEAQARKSPVPVEVLGDGVARYPQDVESAVYFCTLEALNNVAKYAEATRVVVRLSQDDEHLSFEVTDDGSGFDATSKSFGTGLQGMADRLESIGGSFSISSAPGSGTTVSGRLPVASCDR